MNTDHTDNYQLCPPELLRRYVQGLEDGTALLRAARVQRIDAATPDFARAFGRGKNVLLGDDR